MEAVSLALPYIQVTLAVILTTAILLQSRGAGLGGAFGDSQGATFYKRRGAEQMLFIGTIILGVLFALSTFVALII
jgi:preprotein translocase subunit SecG